MTRLIVILCAVLAACNVGDVTNHQTTDGGGSGGMDSGSGTPKCVNGMSPAIAHNHINDGTPHAGQACTNGACHKIGNTGVGAEGFAFAGTLWTDQNATTPNTGAAIVVTINGTPTTVYTDMAGNFYEPASADLTFPAKTTATKCPSLTSMIANLVTGGGNCNTCHSTTAGAITAPLYLQ